MEKRGVFAVGSYNLWYNTDMRETDGIQITTEELGLLRKGWEEAGGEDIYQRQKETNEKKFLEKLELGKGLVLDYLGQTGQANEETLVILEEVVEELQNDPCFGISNFVVLLPNPSRDGYLKVDGGKKKIRQSNYARMIIGYGMSLDEIPSSTRGNSQRYRSQPFWRTLWDVQKAVRDLGLGLPITKLKESEKEVRLKDNAYDHLGIPVFLLLRTRGYSKTDLVR